MADLTRIKEYLDKAKVFYFTTVDGDKPKCRPFGASLPAYGSNRRICAREGVCYPQICFFENSKIKLF